MLHLNRIGRRNRTRQVWRTDSLMRKRSQGYDGAEPFLDEHICCSGPIHVRRRSIVEQEPVAFILRERSLEVDEPARHACRPHGNQGATGHRRYVGSGAEAIIGLLGTGPDRPRPQSLVNRCCCYGRLRLSAAIYRQSNFRSTPESPRKQSMVCGSLDSIRATEPNFPTRGSAGRRFRRV